MPDFPRGLGAGLPEGSRGGRGCSISVSMIWTPPVSREVSEMLAPDGIWHFEQSYMPAMLRTTSYDTVCHEHIEYYSLSVVDRLLREHGLHVADVQMNGINGSNCGHRLSRERALPAQRRMH